MMDASANEVLAYLRSQYAATGRTALRLWLTPAGKRVTPRVINQLCLEGRLIREGEPSRPVYRFVPDPE